MPRARLYAWLRRTSVQSPHAEYNFRFGVAFNWMAEGKSRTFQRFPLSALSQAVIKTTTCCAEDNSRFGLQLTEWRTVIIGFISPHNGALWRPQQLQRAISKCSLSGSHGAEWCTRQTGGGQVALLAGVDWLVSGQSPPDNPHTDSAAIVRGHLSTGWLCGGGQMSYLLSLTGWCTALHCRRRMLSRRDDNGAWMNCSRRQQWCLLCINSRQYPPVSHSTHGRSDM